ncbi:hypothetical protein I551_4754 [Mycobacterium ulcerans str. Harvey]|uniref:Uncharacterized protein n=1 Tax=Mycobacterium ulcerans str. Harvey TaxID=1299332 RepID=A0ABN0QVN6_MYCUL|nr:hypothetical protein I551_4754 [Mycobacterium ulcerans str. Harvey]
MRAGMAEAGRLLGGYDPNAGYSAHAARPKRNPVPSLLRALLSDHLDPGYAAAAAKRESSGASELFEPALSAGCGRSWRPRWSPRFSLPRSRKRAWLPPACTRHSSCW